MANEGTIAVSTLVQTSGNQTISGTKTCSSLVMSESPAASDSSTNVATTAYVNSATSVVHKTGDETISGVKTFSTANCQLLTPILTKQNTEYEGGQLEFQASDSDDYGGTMYIDRFKGTFRFIGYKDGENRVPLVVDINNQSVTSVTPASADSSTRVATTAWVNTVGNGVVHLAGTETITGNKTFTETINGEALYARWGDLAEMYEADASYKPGTLLQFGGKAEMTISVSEVNGVVSTKPGLLINNDIKNKVGIPLPIALIGKVPVRVIGELKKFDRIALSEIPGVATKKTLQEHAIGVCLEDKPDEDEGLVLCSVKLMF